MLEPWMMVALGILTALVMFDFWMVTKMKHDKYATRHMMFMAVGSYILVSLVTITFVVTTALVASHLTLNAIEVAYWVHLGIHPLQSVYMAVYLLIHR